MPTPIQLQEINVVPFNITELTTCTLDGNGVLDTLLRTTRVNLREEFDKGRITGHEYATAFVDTYVATLGTAANYVMSRYELPLKLMNMELQNKVVEGQLSKIPEELNLLRKQVLAQVELTNLTRAQIEQLEAELSKIPHQIAILKKELVLASAKGSLSNLEVDKATTELELKVPIEISNLTKQGDILTAQATKLADELLKTPIEIEMLGKQVASLDAQIAQTTAKTTLVPQELLQLTAQTNQTIKQTSLLDKDLLLKEGQLLIQTEELAISRAKLLNTAKELELLAANVASQEAQSLLYAQKVVSEKAQVDSTVVGTGSIIDLNNKVLMGQSDAYKRDAEQKATKLILDTWTTRVNAGTAGEFPDTANVQDTNVGKAVAAMLLGIGITV